MPIYEYECRKCGKISEALQKFSDLPMTDCPHCKGRLHKLISHSTFHLKGSGWYVTDYAGKNAGNRSVSSGKESGATGENANSKGDDSKKSDS